MPVFCCSFCRSFRLVSLVELSEGPSEPEPEVAKHRRPPPPLIVPSEAAAAARSEDDDFKSGEAEEEDKPRREEATTAARPMAAIRVAAWLVMVSVTE